MFTPRATLPTLLGVLVLILGLYAFLRVPAGSSSGAPTTAQTTPTPQVERSVELVNVGAQETRSVNIQTPDTPNAVLVATLAALRTWLLGAGWPEALGVPTVFRLDTQEVVLDFPLEGTPTVSVQQEQELLASIKQTLAQQDISEAYILTNGRSRPVFLEHLAVERGLE